MHALAPSLLVQFRGLGAALWLREVSDAHGCRPSCANLLSTVTLRPAVSILGRDRGPHPWAWPTPPTATRPNELSQPALGSPNLISEVHRVLAADYGGWAGARPPGVHQATHAAPDMPLRELVRIGPPIRSFLVCNSRSLRQLLFLHCASQPLRDVRASLYRADQYRAEQRYHVISSDLE
jgi:hypothetical protein